jgi:transposase-like protein
VRGRTATDIAGEFGCSASTIYRYLQRCGFSRRRRKASWAEPLRNVIIDTYARGESSLTEVANRVPVTTSTVRAILIHAGSELRPLGHNIKTTRRRWASVLTAAYLTKMYRDMGLTAHEIGALVGADTSTVLRYVRLAGLDVRPSCVRGSFPDLNDEAWLNERWLQGLPARTIAAELGCDTGTVLRWVRKHGLHRNPLRNSTVHDEHIIQRYTQDGATLATIATELGLSRQTVARRLRGLGHEVRRVGPQSDRSL